MDPPQVRIAGQVTEKFFIREMENGTVEHINTHTNERFYHDAIKAEPDKDVKPFRRVPNADGTFDILNTKTGERYPKIGDNWNLREKENNVIEHVDLDTGKIASYETEEEYQDVLDFRSEFSPPTGHYIGIRERENGVTEHVDFSTGEKYIHPEAEEKIDVFQPLNKLVKRTDFGMELVDPVSGVREPYAFDPSPEDIGIGYIPVDEQKEREEFRLKYEEARRQEKNEPLLRDIVGPVKEYDVTPDGKEEITGRCRFHKKSEDLHEMVNMFTGEKTDIDMTRSMADMVNELEERIERKMRQQKEGKQEESKDEDLTDEEYLSKYDGPWSDDPDMLTGLRVWSRETYDGKEEIIDPLKGRRDEPVKFETVSYDGEMGIGVQSVVEYGKDDDEENPPPLSDARFRDTIADIYDVKPTDDFDVPMMTNYTATGRMSGYRKFRSNGTVIEDIDLDKQTREDREIEEEKKAMEAHRDRMIDEGIPVDIFTLDDAALIGSHKVSEDGKLSEYIDIQKGTRTVRALSPLGTIDNPYHARPATREEIENCEKNRSTSPIGIGFMKELSDGSIVSLLSKPDSKGRMGRIKETDTDSFEHIIPESKTRLYFGDLEEDITGRMTRKAIDDFEEEKREEREKREKDIERDFNRKVAIMEKELEIPTGLRNFQSTKGPNRLKQLDLETGESKELETVTALRDREIVKLGNQYAERLVKENRAITPKEFEMCALTTSNLPRLKMLDHFISKLKIVPTGFDSKQMLMAYCLIPKGECGIGIRLEKCASPGSWNVLRDESGNRILETNTFLDFNHHSMNDAANDLTFEVFGLEDRADIELIGIESTQFLKKISNFTYNPKTKTHKCHLKDMLWFGKPWEAICRFVLRLREFKIPPNIIILWSYNAYILSSECRRALDTLASKIDFKPGDKTGEFVFKEGGTAARSQPVGYVDDRNTFSLEHERLIENMADNL